MKRKFMRKGKRIVSVVLSGALLFSGLVPGTSGSLSAFAEERDNNGDTVELIRENNTELPELPDKLTLDEVQEESEGDTRSLEDSSFSITEENAENTVDIGNEGSVADSESEDVTEEGTGEETEVQEEIENTNEGDHSDSAEISETEKDTIESEETVEQGVISESGAVTGLPEMSTDEEIRSPESYYEVSNIEVDGVLVDYDETSRTYLVEENVSTDKNGEPVNSYVTVIGDSSEYFLDADGKLQTVDNTLVPGEGKKNLQSVEEDVASPSNIRRRMRMAKKQESVAYTNTSGKAHVTLPEHMSSSEGYVISDGKEQVEVLPVVGDFSRSEISENMIRYSSVFPNVDVQYTVLNDSVKEDIILLSPEARIRFQYRLKSGLKYKKQGEALLIYKNSVKNPLFVITAPVMIDASGASSTDIQLFFDSSSDIVTFSADPDWLNAEERVYPVRIDPGAQLVEPDAFTLNMIAKGDGVAVAESGTYDNAIRNRHFGDDGRTLVGYHEEYGYTRAMIDIETDWSRFINDSSILDENGAIKNIEFSITPYTNDTPQRSAFEIRAINADWDSSNITWNRMEELGLASDLGSEAVPGVAYSSGPGNELTFDVTEFFQKWVEGNPVCKGLMMEVQAETPPMVQDGKLDISSVSWAETFYNRSGGSANGPRLQIAWEGKLNGKDLSTLSMEDFTLEIGAGVEESTYGGRTVKGVLLHGISQAGASIETKILKKDGGEEVFSSSSTAEDQVGSPDYTKVTADCIEEKHKDSNWQTEDSAMYEVTLDLDTIYYATAEATGHEIETAEDGTLSATGPEITVERDTSDTDTFLLYEVQETDLLARIARHYGTTVKQIQKDNQFGRQLTYSGDVLFIRNPNTAEPYTARMDEKSMEQYTLNAILQGRNIRCELDMEPINMSTGGFYLNHKDAEMPELSGTFTISRSYNSLTPYFRSEFGYGWNSLFGEKIMVLRNGAIIFVKNDGQGISFTKTGEKAWSAGDGYDYVLRAVDQVEEELKEKSVEEGEEENEEGNEETEVVSRKARTRIASPSEIRSQALRKSPARNTDSEEDADNTEKENHEIGDESVVPASTGWEIEEPDGTLRQFNSYGLLVMKKDRKGHQFKYTYDEDYLLTKITTETGKEILVSMTEEGIITALTLPDQETIHYSYDEGWNLISVTDPEGGVIRYAYDQEHHMTSWTDQIGSVIVENQYDENGRVQRQTDAEGNTATLSYDGQETILTDNNGNKKIYTQDEEMRNIRITYANGDTEEKIWNAENRLGSVTSSLGVVTKYSYDERGNLLTETREDGAEKRTEYNDLNLPVSTSDFEGHTTTYSYDELGNLLSITTPEGEESRFTYDELSRVTSFTDGNGHVQSFRYEGASSVPAAMTDGEGNATSFDYDGMDRKLSETDPLGHTKSWRYNRNGWNTVETDENGNATTYQYDASGNVRKMVDKEGQATDFTYDKLHHILSGTDAEGNILRYEYDKNYNKIVEIDAEGHKRSFAFDSRNRMVATTDAKQNSITYELDGAGNVIRSIDRRGATQSTVYDPILLLPVKTVDELGYETIYHYDRDGRTTKIEYPNGAERSNQYDRDGRLIRYTAENGLVTDIAYDRVGNITRIQDAEDRIYRFSYDGRNLLVKATDPLGNSKNYQYDKAGHLVTLTDENDHSTSYRYDPVGRLVEATDALEGHTQKEYDKNGVLLKEIDENGHATEYLRNKIGQLTGVVDAEEQITAYNRDRVGNVILKTNALKGESRTSYDVLSLPITVKNPAGSLFYYSYDENENLVKVTYPDGDIVTFVYDAKNQLIQYTDEAGLVTDYQYDSMGNVVSTKDNAGNRKTVEYDLSGNIVFITDTIGRVTRYEYDSFGRVVKTIEKDGAETSYSYDAMDRLLSITAPDGTVSEYSYDGVGNRTSETRPGEARYTYTYDALNRLTELQNPLSAVTKYQYDAASNLTEVTDGEGNRNQYLYDKVNRLVAHTNGRGNTENFSYDALSRLISHVSAEGNATAYRYDSVSNLIAVQDPNGLVTEYTYDSMGNRRSEKSPRNAITLYNYDAHDILTEEIDAYGNATKYEVDLNGRVIKRTEKNGAEYHYSYDPVHRLTGIRTPLGYELNFTYSLGDDILMESDNLSRTTEYQYDIMHRLISMKDAEGGVKTYRYDIRGNQSSYTNTLGHTRNYSYDLIDELTESIDPEGKITKYQYNLVGELSAVTKPADRTTSFRYDENYNLTGRIDAKGYLYQASFDKDDRTIGTEDPLQQGTALRYDAGSRLTGTTDKMGFVQSLSYDAHGNVTKFTEKDGKNTGYEYDLLDRLTRVTLPSGLSSQYEYDGMGNLVTATDLMGRVQTREYDAENNLVSLTDAAGRTEKQEYDIASRLISHTSNAGNVIRYDYDKLDDLVKKYYSGKEEAETAQPVLYGYDSEGERVSMVDRSGKSSYQYDTLGRIKEVKDGAGAITKYAYDEGDRLASITYADGKTVSYQYDKNDNLTAVMDRSGKKTSYTYDPLNRVTEIQRPNGISSYFSYDANDRITEMVNRCDLCGWVVSDYKYTYDEKGFILTEDAVESLYGYAFDDKHNGKHTNGRHDDWYSHGTQHRQKHGTDAEPGFQIIETNRSFTYDADGKLLQAVEEERQGQTIYDFRYDGMGNRTYYGKTVRGVLSESVESSYNSVNQPVTAVEYDGKHYYDLKYIYDEDGNLIEEQRGKNGNLKTEHTYTYWVENRLKAIYDTHDVLMAAAYDGDGNRVFQLNYNLHTDDDWKGNSGNGKGNNKDNKGQGNSGNGNSGSSSGSSKGNGNGKNKGGNGKSKGGNGKNKGNNGNGGNGYHYGWGFGSGAFSGLMEDPTDNNGNAFGNTNNTGGSQNQSGILFPESGQISIIEQDLLDLIRTAGKDKNYELIQYVNDVNREYAEVLMELNENGGWDTAYSYGNERVSADRFDGTSAYYLYEGRGSVSAVTSANGTLKASYRYNAYGAITFGKPTYNNVYAYNGESYNPNLDGVYLRARYYHVESANFFTEDRFLGVLSDPLSLNRYNYVNSSYLNYKDPSGYMRDDDYFRVDRSSSQKSRLTKFAEWTNRQLIETINNLPTATVDDGIYHLEVKFEIVQSASEADLCDTVYQIGSFGAGLQSSLDVGNIANDFRTSVPIIGELSKPNQWIRNTIRSGLDTDAYDTGVMLGELYKIIALRNGSATLEEILRNTNDPKYRARMDAFFSGLGGGIGGKFGAAIGTMIEPGGGTVIVCTMGASIGVGSGLIASEGLQAVVKLSLSNASSLAKAEKERLEEKTQETKSRPTSQNQMQKQVERGKAPKSVDRVDKPHVDGQKPHIHFGENEAALNVDGTWHDEGQKSIPKLDKKTAEWITNNGWSLPNE